VNVQDLPSTDIVADMSKLTMFPNDTVTAIYSSHTLEHTPFLLNDSARQVCMV
jgi:predicted SAM-dependent methyltransferase